METLTQEERIKQALEVEKMRFFREVEGITRDRQGELAEAENDLSRRGLSHSGIRNHRLAQIYQKALQRMLDTRLALRREMARFVPELASPESLAVLQAEAERMIDGPARAALVDSHGPQCLAVDERMTMKAKVRREVEILKREVRLGMAESPTGMLTINIAGNTIASLNLGTVVGDIQAITGDLRSKGNVEVAEAIQQLTEAVAACQQLGDKRREAIEQLATIGDQAVLPQPRRRLEVVRGLLSSLRETLSVVESLRPLWEKVGSVISAYFQSSMV